MKEAERIVSRATSWWRNGRDYTDERYIKGCRKFGSMPMARARKIKVAKGGTTAVV